MFQPQHIKWIKSVTRDGGNDWAYMEFNVGDVFELRFPNNPKWYPKNYGKPQPNELITLFQTLLPQKGIVGGWYVTHLVSPIDSIVEHDTHTSHPYKRLVAVVGKAAPPFLVDKAFWSFYKPNRGPVCNIKTIEKRVGPDYSVSYKQNFIWSAFNNVKPELYEEIKKVQEIAPDDEIAEATEGAEKTFMKIHKTRERNHDIVAKAKKKAKDGGRFYCQACFFNFERIYPDLGEGFIECHHKLPISTGGVRTTKIEHLVLVCSNCHRMLHRKLSGKYLTVEELKEKFF